MVRILVSSDQSGANRPIDNVSNRVFNFSVGDTYDFWAARFVIKKGSNSTDGVTASVYSGFNGSGPLLGSIFIDVASLSQSFTAETFDFSLSGIQLNPSQQDYSLILTTNTGTGGNQQIFIKDGNTVVEDFDTSEVIATFDPDSGDQLSGDPVVSDPGQALANSEVGRRFVGRISGIVTYSDGTTGSFAAHIDEDGVVSANVDDTVQSIPVFETQNQNNWLESIFAELSGTLALNPSPAPIKTVSDAVLHMSGRVSRPDGTWEDFAVQYESKIGTFISNSSGSGSNSTGSGDTSVYNEFDTIRLRRWLESTVGKGNVTT